MKKKSFYNQVFVNNLNSLMKKNGLTKLFVAEKIHLNRRTLDRVLEGKTHIDLPSFFKAADLLDVDCEELAFSDIIEDEDISILNEPDAEFLFNSDRPEKIDYGIARILNLDSMKDYTYKLKNDSMDPFIRKDDLVVCEKILGDNYDPFKPYIICTKFGCVIGYIRQEGEYLKIKPESPMFSIKDVLISEVAGVYMVKLIQKMVNV